MIKKRKKRKKITLSEIQEKIRKRALKNSVHAINVGLNREDLVTLTLREMKQKHEIVDYLPTGRFSKADIKGIDFIVITAGKSRYEKIKISVTGPRWVSCHQKKHPNVSVLCVEDNDDIEAIGKKILVIINPEA